VQAKLAQRPAEREHQQHHGGRKNQRLPERHRFVDAFRVVNQETDQYTWWSNRGRAWEKNVGWRIDYHIITPALADRVRRVGIYQARRSSGHAPLMIDYDLELSSKPWQRAAS
jgi:exonuclease III